MARIIEGIGIIMAMIGAACIDSENMIPWAAMVLIGSALLWLGSWIDENYWTADNDMEWIDEI